MSAEFSVYMGDLNLSMYIMNQDVYVKVRLDRLSDRNLIDL